MYNFIKYLVKNFFKFFGLDIKRHYPEINQKSFNQIYSEILKDKRVIIFDVGANQGQTIERFNKIFKEKIIHSFEPIEFEFLKLKNKYNDRKNIFLNNFAIGSSKGEKNFFINHYTGSSSFLRVKKDTQWLNLRSQQYKIKPEKFLNKVNKTTIYSIDDYCTEKQIDEIDIIKVDTQGYEDEVLEGCQKMLSENKIKFIELEIIFSDIYEKSLTISDIESKLQNNYRLFANDFYGNLYSNMIYQLNLIYINKNFYNKSVNIKNEAKNIL